MSPCELVTLVSAISCAIAKGKSIDELNILSAIFSQIGDSLTTIAVSRSICENSSASVNNTNTTSTNNNSSSLI